MNWKNSVQGMLSSKKDKQALYNHKKVVHAIVCYIMCTIYVFRSHMIALCEEQNSVISVLFIYYYYMY